VDLISNRNERPRTREGNFPFTAQENADRGVTAVKPGSSVVTNPLDILTVSRYPLERGSLRDESRYGAATNRIIDLYGVADWQPDGTFDVRRSSRRRLPERTYTCNTRKLGSGTREESPAEEAAAR